MGKPFIDAYNKKIELCQFRTLAEFTRRRNLYLWLPVTVVSPRLPWGYKRDPNNSKVALPQEEAIACFLKAYEYLKEHSYETVSEWLGTCGFPLSDDGLIKLFKERPVWDELKLPLEERMKL